MGEQNYGPYVDSSSISDAPRPLHDYVQTQVCSRALLTEDQRVSRGRHVGEVTGTMRVSSVHTESI